MPNVPKGLAERCERGDSLSGGGCRFELVAHLLPAPKPPRASEQGTHAVSGGDPLPDGHGDVAPLGEHMFLRWMDFGCLQTVKRA